MVEISEKTIVGNMVDKVVGKVLIRMLISLMGII